MSDYILQVGEQGKERLELLTHFTNENSKIFLAPHLSNGMHVCEVGCGNGSMTMWLAEQVGTKGKVMAIDSSDKQLMLTKSKMDQIGFTNIEYVCLDIENENNKLTGNFDLIYSRCLFLHLQKPKKVLSTYYELIKHGGTAALEEPIITETLTYPESNVWEIALNSYIELSILRGINYNYGLQLFNDISNSNFTNIEITRYNKFFKKELIVDYLVKLEEEMQETYLNNNILNMGKAERESYLNIFLKNAKYIDFRYGSWHCMVQAAGTK